MELEPMSKTIELKDHPTIALERKITAALTDITPAADLAALIEETEAAIAEAEKEQAVADPSAARQAIDAMVAVNRLGLLLLKLQARYQEVHEQEEIVTWRAERKAAWLAEHDAWIAERDALAEELRDVYSELTRRMADLFVRIAANNEALDELSRTRPEGVQRDLRSVELHARGLDAYSRERPSLLASVCLFDWDTGRQICPPQRPSMAAACAATMMPASDRRFSGEWWKDAEDGAARQRAEQLRIADTYSRMTKEQEARENAEARERFAAHQPKNSV
jgi:hypothetical protein